MKTSADYLRELLDYLDQAITFTSEGRDSFMQDKKTQFAVIRVYEVVGEIAKRLPDELRAANPQLDWRRLMGFRDFLAHNYDQIILSFVWTAIEDVPKLKAAVSAILAHLNTPQDAK